MKDHDAKHTKVYLTLEQATATLDKVEIRIHPNRAYPFELIGLGNDCAALNGAQLAAIINNRFLKFQVEAKLLP